MSTAALPVPVRHFLAELDDARSGETADMDQVGRLLTGLAVDEEFFTPLIAAMPDGTPGRNTTPTGGRGTRSHLVTRAGRTADLLVCPACWPSSLLTATPTSGSLFPEREGHVCVRAPNRWVAQGQQVERQLEWVRRRTAWATALTAFASA